MVDKAFSQAGKTVGSVAQDIFGFAGDYYAKERERDAIRAQKEAEDKAYGIGSQYYTDMEKEYAPEASTYLSDIDKWRSEMSQKLPEYKQFDSSGYTVNKYLDPSIDYQVDQASKGINQGAFAKGGALSGATLKALSDRAQNIGKTGWQEAFNNMTTDRQFGYGDYTKKYDSDLAREMQYRASLGDLSKQSGAARDDLFQTRAGKTELDQSHEYNQGDLNAQQHQLMANYLKGQFTRGGKTANTISSQAGDAAGKIWGTPTPKVGGGL
jgi:hypothetical protein